MLSDQEVNCLYLGRPFEEKVLHSVDTRAEERPLSAQDAERILSTLPLLNELIYEACAGAR